MSKEEIITAIRECAQKLGRAPSFYELKRTVNVKQSTIRKLFGTYTRAVRASGMEREGSGHPVALNALFLDWAGMVRKLGKLPTVAEYETHSKYSVQPLFTHFGTWRQAPLGLLLYAEQNGLEEEWKDVLELVRTREQKKPLRQRGGAQATMRGLRVTTGMGTDKEPENALLEKPKLIPGRPTFGPALTGLAMVHGPENEDGVLFLFGALATQLGFEVLRIQKGFPDCQAIRRIDENTWQFVRIEFEFQSRNFLKHLHDAKGCDLIVCWEHNWLECPLEVVELKAAFSSQHSASKDRRDRT